MANTGTSKKIVIEPVTRVEGHGKVTILLKRYPFRLEAHKRQLEGIATKLDGVCLERLLDDDELRQAHFGAMQRPAKAERGRPDLFRLAAYAKLNDAQILDEALAWLSPRELLAAISEHELFAYLLRLRATQDREHNACDGPALLSTGRDATH